MSYYVFHILLLSVSILNVSFRGFIWAGDFHYRLLVIMWFMRVSHPLDAKKMLP